jgi:anti-anti-sigma factor
VTRRLFAVRGACHSMRVPDALYADQILQIFSVDQPWGLRLVGQVDLSHRQILQQHLERATQQNSDLFIDMGELEFIDVGGIRLVLDTAVVLAVDNRKLVIGHPRPAVRRTLRICNWDNIANLLIIDGPPMDEREAG